MRTDLLDAQSAVNWAVAQIQLQQGFIDWQRANPYEVVQEIDPGTGDNIAVTYDQPFPLEFNAWVGAIINSLRSSLDLLAATLATRNGKKPCQETHFPVFRSIQDMIDPLEGLKSKKWLSASERATIKTLKPYEGGNDTIWPLHRLDILRKHERLIKAQPDVAGFLMLGARHIHVGGTKAIKRMENKTILLNLPPGETLYATQGNTLLAVFITFREIGIGLDDQEVATVLRRFVERVGEIIKLFDLP
jgi:hypothetical protein